MFFVLVGLAMLGLCAAALVQVVREALALDPLLGPQRHRAAGSGASHRYPVASKPPPAPARAASDDAVALPDGP